MYWRTSVINILWLHCAFMFCGYTVLLYFVVALCFYVLWLHCAFIFCGYTVLLYFVVTLCFCILWLHCAFIFCGYTVLLYFVVTLCFYILWLHCAFIFCGYAVLVYPIYHFLETGLFSKHHVRFVLYIYIYIYIIPFVVFYLFIRSRFPNKQCQPTFFPISSVSLPFSQ